MHHHRQPSALAVTHYAKCMKYYFHILWSHVWLTHARARTQRHQRAHFATVYRVHPVMLHTLIVLFMCTDSTQMAVLNMRVIAPDDFYNIFDMYIVNTVDIYALFIKHAHNFSVQFPCQICR